MTSEQTPRPLNVNAAVASFLVPGLGQLFQERWYTSYQHFTLFLVGIGAVSFEPYFFLFSALLAVFSTVDAAVWRGEKQGRRYRPMIIIGILLFFACLFALMISTIQPQSESARQRQCISHLKNIGNAFHNYHDTYGTLPPAYTVDENGRTMHNWRVLLLPFVEQYELYKKIRLDEPWDSEHNRQFHEIDPWSLRIYRCPSGSPVDGVYKKYPGVKKGNCHYSVIVGPETPFPGAESTTFADCTDGLSNTLLLVERMTPICWMDPNNEITFDVAYEGVNRNLLGIGSAHPGGANCSFMDTSCHFLPENVNLKPFLTKSAGDDADRKVFYPKN